MFARMVKMFLATITVSAILCSCASVADNESRHSSGLNTAGQTPGSVLTGIDVLEKSAFTQLAGRNVGLITNQTGINYAGISNIQLLHEAENVNLIALFNPEHGLFGKLDVETIEDSRDTTTGVNIFSLYGSNRRPTSEMLEGLDTLVFDIQDIGTRFYTYISTMGHAMQAAAENHVRFVVLDRPNPINGLTVSGPVLDEGKQSFVGFHLLPVRHGMTIGELAHMFKVELQLELELEIIPLKNWSRADYFDSTGLQWINPSPNMRSLTEAILYPGIGLLETTNLSVGRGTDTPFEWFGAPWIDANLLEKELSALDLPGVQFAAVQFTPDAIKFEGQLCHGIAIQITNRARFESVRTGLEIAVQLRRLFPKDWDSTRYDRLLGNEVVLEAIKAGKSYADIEVGLRQDLEGFERRRAKFLIYE